MHYERQPRCCSRQSSSPAPRRGAWFSRANNPNTAETYAITKADLLLKGEGDEAENSPSPPLSSFFSGFFLSPA